jgi:zinc transporter
MRADEQPLSTRCYPEIIMTDFMLHAYKIDGKGGGVSLSYEQVYEELNDDNLAWVHLDAEHIGSREWLNSEAVMLDPIVINALLDEETRPRMSELGDGCMVILRGVNLNPGQDPEDMVSIRLWIEGHRIISMQRRPLKAITEMVKRLESGKGIKDSGAFLTDLSLRLLDRMTPILTELSETMDDIEEQVVESGEYSHREQIVAARMQAIFLRRYLTPQRDVMASLRASDFKWLTDLNKRSLQESYNTVMRHAEDLDAIRERAQIVKDELTAMLADKMNKNMYVLSVIAAIFLPLGFLTGLLGINIGGIPGSENGAAFVIFCLMLIVLVTLQIYVFRKMKWI